MKRSLLLLILIVLGLFPRAVSAGGPRPLKDIDVTGTDNKLRSGAMTIKSGALLTSEAGSTVRLAKIYAGTTVTTTTALVHIDAGGTAAGSAPLKFTLGSLLTTPESGAVEYDGDFVYLTPANGARQRISTDAATKTISASAIDWSLSGTYSKALAANTTFTFSNAVDGKTIVVALTNTASNWTVTWPTVIWSGGSPPTQTIGAKTDVYTFVKIGSTIYGSVVQNFF